MKERALLAEFLGTLVLVMCSMGTGIMGMRLAPDLPGLTLLACSITTGLILWLLITLFGPVSGAHMNPAVTLYFALRRDIALRTALGYVPAQLAGALAAVLLTHAMFALPLIQTAATVRSGGALVLSEAVATLGLILTIAGGQREAPALVPALVGAWITTAFWFTGSASFANPAVTFARMFSDTFTGIRPADAPLYMLAELAAALVGAWTAGKLFPR